jgi:hypothetical protein
MPVMPSFGTFQNLWAFSASELLTNATWTTKLWYALYGQKIGFDYNAATGVFTFNCKANFRVQYRARFDIANTGTENVRVSFNVNNGGGDSIDADSIQENPITTNGNMELYAESLLGVIPGSTVSFRVRYDASTSVVVNYFASLVLTPF